MSRDLLRNTLWFKRMKLTVDCRPNSTEPAREYVDESLGVEMSIPPGSPRVLTVEEEPLLQVRLNGQAWG